MVACITLAGVLHQPADHRVFLQTYFTWFHVGGLTVPVGIQVDQLSITMCMFITGVSMLIHLYSIGYMKSDRDYPKFFIYLNLFVFSMLLLVLANNLLLTFVGWEGVGVCSYWLVSYWFHRTRRPRPARRPSSTTASVTSASWPPSSSSSRRRERCSTWAVPAVGSSGRPTISAEAPPPPSSSCCSWPPTGKSAQIPLFNWLPDAMEGPTPVSALIHAATMVTAGVYLLCRMNHVLFLSSNGTEVIAAVGGITAFVAATIACAQQDIKKVLAFSTVSQIGYMILAVGSGAYIAAIFLMVCHAFYKGLLFLSAPDRSSMDSTTSRTSSAWARCARP